MIGLVLVTHGRLAVEFRSALEWGLTLDGPSVIEAFVDVESYSRTVFD